MKDFFKFKAINETSAVVEIYDEIYSDSARYFIDQCKKFKNSRLSIRINSPGGDPFAGFAIYDFLKNRGNVDVVIEGLAASAASFIAMAGDKISIYKNGFIMIHNAQNWSGGEKKDLRKNAEVMDKIDEKMSVIYANKTGIDKEKIITMMDETTFMTAEEAIELGFVDEIIESAEFAACANFDKFNYKNIPQALIKIQQGEKMKTEILAALGVGSEVEILPKFEALKTVNDDLSTAISAMKAKNEEMKKVLDSQKIDLLISAKKLLPAQKQWATKLLAKDEELFNEFVAENKIETPPMTPLPATNNDGVGDETYEALLSNPSKMIELQNANPQKYEALKAAYREARK